MLRFGAYDDRFREYSSSAFVLIPVPFDGTSSWGRGADRAPQAILAASYYLEDYDIDSGVEPYRHGIYVAEPVIADLPADLAGKVKSETSRHLNAGKTAIGLGGNHSVSPGFIQAYREKYPALSVLHLDAHADTRDSYEGTPYSHASAIARAAETGARIVSAGIRSIDISELDNLKGKGRVFYAAEMLREERTRIISRITESLTDDVYITIDLDVFDPSVMPSTGTPEPGGLDWYYVDAIIRAVAEKKGIRGFDVVELAPNPGLAAPDFLAAKLIYSTIAKIIKNK